MTDCDDCVKGGVRLILTQCPPHLPSAIPIRLTPAFLAVSEDRIAGFVRNPMLEISRACDLPVEVVIERIQAMLQGGTIRRVRQTLMSTDLAPGALVAWEVDADRLDDAFDYMFQRDPFRVMSWFAPPTPPASGSQYKLWTTLKVPHGFSMRKHADFLRDQVGARSYRLMPAKGIFALGVGHTRRKSMEPGAKSDGRAEMHTVRSVKLGDLEWRVLMALKREFEPEEICENIWEVRAREVDLPLPVFFEVAESLNQQKVVGRFSTFLEHVKPTATGERVTRFNALFHWAVPAGRELEAGQEIGRHHILTHCYWREGGPRIQSREYHGGGARHRPRHGARAQGGHRRAFAGDRHAVRLHECFLGRPQRDQAVRNRACGVCRLVSCDENRSRNDEGLVLRTQNFRHPERR